MNTRRNALGELASNKEWERIGTGILTLFVFPAIMAALGAFTPDLLKEWGKGVWAIWAVVALVFGLSAIRLQLSSRSALALVVDNERQEDTIAELQADVEQLSTAINLLALQAEFSGSARAVVLSHARRGISTIEQLKEALADLAAPLYSEGEFLFDFKASERWSFTIFLYSANSALLLPVWRERSTRFPQHSEIRKWGLGEGHVGKAFVDQKAIITGDVRVIEAAEFSSLPPGRGKPDDDALYVSFASIPIGPILQEDNRPYSVIVGTSDAPGRFDREKAGIVVQVAGTVASLLITGGLDIDQIWGIESRELPGGTQ